MPISIFNWASIWMCYYIIWQSNNIRRTNQFESVQNNLLRSVYFKCERHSDHKDIQNLFKLKSVMIFVVCVKVMSLLRKLLNNEIDHSFLLDLSNFRSSIRIIHANQMYFIFQNLHENMSSFPIVILLTSGNNINPILEAFLYYL